MITLNRCIEVAGGDRVGRFLYRLHRWTAFTRIVRGGVKWVALTYAQWADELAVSYTQFKYLLEKAAAAGQVVREQHRFRGLKVLFVRLSDATRAAIAHTSARAGAQAGEGKSAQTGLGKTAQVIRNSTQETIEETKIASGPAAAAAPVPTPAPTLEALWREARPSAPITQKMRGQFRHLVRTLRTGEAERVVRYALAHWPRVVRAAEKHHGAFKSPDLPQLGFLVKHIEAARVLTGKTSRPEEPPEAVNRSSVVLSVAKDLIAACNRHEILPFGCAQGRRCAQDDKRNSARRRPAIMTYREMLLLEASPGAGP